MYKLILPVVIAMYAALAGAQDVKATQPGSPSKTIQDKKAPPKKLVSEQDIKAVYHINTDVDTVTLMLTYIRNHMATDPKVKIVVVTHGPGINFLIQDAKDSQGREFSAAVSDLAGKGVEFRVCNITLVSRNISPSTLLMETTLVPSGVAEVARLQTREGFVYLKP